MELVELLRSGVTEFNGWRRDNLEAEINLRDADLNGANLRDADLRDADLNWSQPEIIAEILRQNATTRDQTAYSMMVAGARLTGWYWKEFLEYLEDKPDLRSWSIDLLKQWSNDDAPQCIREG